MSPLTSEIPYPSCIDLHDGDSKIEREDVGPGGRFSRFPMNSVNKRQLCSAHQCCGRLSVRLTRVKKKSGNFHGNSVALYYARMTDFFSPF